MLVVVAAGVVAEICPLVAPLPKSQEILTAITGLFFFSNYNEAFE